MTKPWVHLRHDSMAGCWIMTCDLCGLRERWWKFWEAQRVMAAHAAIHEDD